MIKRLWHEKLSNLVKQCKNNGITVRFVPDYKTRDYLGMNEEAAKRIGYPCPKNTIHIDKNMNARDKYGTLVHELIERKLMKDGETYWSAHKTALAEESTPAYD